MRLKRSPLRATKKTTVKRTVKRRAVKKQARKTVISKKTKRRKRTKKSSFSFSQLKAKLNSKITKTIVGLSFVSAIFPSAYEWGSSHISNAAVAAQPIIAEQAESAVKLVVSASPFAKTAAGIWVIDQMSRWATPSYHEGGNSASIPTSSKVDTVVNPFY